MGNCIQKNLYFPEPHTDFIFAVLVEEFGVAGSLILLALYAFLIVGIIMTAIKSIELGNLFDGLLAFGTGILIAIQALFNIGVNLGMLPTKGLTLPFISYGGTSLIIFMFMIGMVLRINYENRVTKYEIFNFSCWNWRTYFSCPQVLLIMHGAITSGYLGRH